MHKRDGNEYERASLAAMKGAIDNYGNLTSRNFTKSREVLKGKACVLSAQGMSKKPKTHAALKKVKKILCGNVVNLGKKYLSLSLALVV